MSERSTGSGGWDTDWERPDDVPPRRGASVFDNPAPGPGPYAPTQPAYPPGPAIPPHQAYPGQAASPGQAHVPPPTRPQPAYGAPAPTQPQPQPQGPYAPQRPQPRYEQQPPRHRRPRAEPVPDGGRGGERGSNVKMPFGLGFLFGVAGLGCFLLALFVLPWFTAGSEDVGLADLREGFTVAETDAGALPGASAGEPAVGEGGVPTAGEVSDVVEDEARDIATETAANAIDDGKSRYLEMYVNTLYLIVAAGVVLAVVFSTVLTPRSTVASLLLGFRRMSGAVTVLAAGVHGAALWVVFTGDGAPSPAFGVWLGLVGLAGVLMGCILGPKRS